MKNILILNWRDPKSPLEGGAERFTKKYAEYWASNGNKVYWITNSFLGSKNKEKINGVEYIRVSPILNGSLLSYLFKYPVFLVKIILFSKKFIKKEKIDIVIDEIHGFPFFTPLYSKVRNVLLTCEVAGPIWDKMFPFPINLIGKYMEMIIYKIYKNTEIWAISENTKKNIIGILPNKKVLILPLGIDENKGILNKIKDVKKTIFPSAIFLARLVKMKGIEVAIDATKEIVKKIPNFKLYIVGSGKKQYVDFLKNKTSKMNLSDNVEFLGKVSELKKFSYLKKSHFLLHPSYKEGFGLTVLEAGLVGTPAIIRTGSSLDFLVKNGENGYLFNEGKEVKNIFSKMFNENHVKMQRKARRIAKKYFWNKALKSSGRITGI